MCVCVRVCACAHVHTGLHTHLHAHVARQWAGVEAGVARRGNGVEDSAVMDEEERVPNPIGPQEEHDGET